MLGSLALGQMWAAPRPDTRVAASPDAVYVNVGAKFVLSAPHVGDGKLVYRWFKDGRPISGATASRYGKSGVTWGNSGAYTLEVTDKADGVKATRTFFVNVALARGHLMAWGDNENGQTDVPAALLPPAVIHAIAAGGAHSLAISAGTVFAWGANAAGQCEVPAWGSLKTHAVAAGEAHSLALLTDGTVRGWGDNSAGQCNVPADLGVVRAIAAGGSHSLALLHDGRIVGWGENASGQLDAPEGLTEALAIAAGHDHSLAVLANGTVVAWGANDLGQCTVPAGLKKITSIGAAGDVSFAITSAGKVHAWGDTSFGQAPAPAKLKPMAQAAGGWDFIAGRIAGGALSVWGAGAEPLATGTKGVGRIQTMAAGGGHLLALRNGTGDGRPVIKARPVAPATTEWDQPVELGVGVKGASPLLRYQWYFNGRPIPGANEATYRIEGMNLHTVGAYHARIYNGSQHVDSLAANIVSPVLPRFVAGRIGPTRVVAGLGERFSLAAEATGAGAIRAEWRHNGVPMPGETTLALEKTIAGAADAGVYEAVVRDEANRMLTVPFFVVVPPAQPTQVVAWGDNSLGQTEVPAGLQDVVELATGQSHTVALRADGTVVAWGDDAFGQSTVPEDLHEVVAIAAGAAYSAALQADGTLVAWGGGRAPVRKATDNPHISLIRLAASGVFGLERFERSYTLGTLSSGADIVAYSLLANGNAAGGSLAWHFAPLLPLPAPVAGGAGSRSVIGSRSVWISSGSFSTSIIIGGGDEGAYPSYPNARSFVYPDYATGVVKLDHKNGASAVLDAAGRLRFWSTGWFWDENYWGQRERYVASSPVNEGGTIEGVSDVAVGAGFYVWRRNDGGVGGFGSEPAAFLRAPYRLDGVRSLRAGSRHAVAVLEAEAPEEPRVVELSEGRAAAPGEMVRLRVRAEGRHLRYQWLHNGEAVEGAEDASLDIVGFDAARAGSYRVRLSDGFTSVLSEPCELSVGVAPVLAQAPATRLGLREGDRFELRAEPGEQAGEGSGEGDGWTYEWLRAGVALPGESGPALVRESVVLADAGRYTLKVRAASGATTLMTSHVFVIPRAGTRIVHENEELYPRRPASAWSGLDDVVDFLSEGLALRLDGRVVAWTNGFIRDETTLAWLDQLRDVVAIAGWGVLRADGRVDVSPNATILQEAADGLRDVVALLSSPSAVVTADGRLGVFESRSQGGLQLPSVVRWFPSVGDFVSARAVAVATTPEKSTNSGTGSERVAVVIGADGSVVTTHSGGLLGFAGQSSARRVLLDREDGVSIIDAEGEVRAAAVFGRFREGDPATAAIKDVQAGQWARAELHPGGEVRAWATNWTTGVKTERDRLAVWRRDNLSVRMDDSRVMVLRSRASLPSVTFAHQRIVVAADQPVVLEPEIGGGVEGVFQWERNGVVLRQATSVRLELPAGDPRNPGWYRLRFTDVDGNFAEAVAYVQVRTPGARIEALPNYGSYQVPDWSDVVDIGNGIAIRADGSVTMWKYDTGAVFGVVPDSVREVVAVTGAGMALDATGKLTRWNPATGEILRVLEGVLWLRTGERSGGLAIMRDGTVQRLDILNSGVPATTPFGAASEPEIVDMRESSILRGTSLFQVRRDGSVKYSYDGFGKSESVLSAEMIGGTVFDIRVPFGESGELLIETPEGEVRIANRNGVSQPTRLRAFDRAPLSALAIDADGRLVSATGVPGRGGVLRLQSPWLLATPQPSEP